MVRKQSRKGDEFLLDHTDVPYVIDWAKDTARPFLPDRSSAPPDAAGVGRFISLTDEDPDTRMAVLGVLRTHAANGAEVVLSSTALLISASGVVLAATRIGVKGGWAPVLSVAEAAALFGVVICGFRRAGAAHIRKLTTLAWLEHTRTRSESNHRAVPRRLASSGDRSTASGGLVDQSAIGTRYVARRGFVLGFGLCGKTRVRDFRRTGRV